MKRKLLSLALVLALCLSLAVPTFAIPGIAVASIGNTFGTGSCAYAITNDGVLYAIERGGTPSKILENMASVATSGNWGTQFAISTGGTLWTWNDYIFEETQPAAIMEDVAMVCTSESHSLAIKTDGTLWAWGSNRQGELGTGEKDPYIEYSDTGENSTEPVKIMDNVVSVSAASSSRYGSYTLAVKTDGSLWAWGGNEYGQLGNGGTGNWRFRWGSNDDHFIICQSTPVKIMDDVVSAVASDSCASYAIKKDGSLWGWGSNASGQLGDGTFKDRNTPAKIMDNVVSVSADDTTSAKPYGICLAVKKDGTLWGWGSCSGGEFGNFGSGYNMNNSDGYGCQTVPIQLANGVVATHAIHHHSLVLKADGTLWALNGEQVISNVKTSVNSPLMTTDGMFADVSSSAYYSEPVQWAVDKAITTGTTATTFSPAQDCTVAQILTFLWRAAGSPEAKAVEGVDASQYYAGAAAWAVEKGMIEAGDFKATAPCTRAMAVEYIWKAAGSPKADDAGFDDVPADAAYADAVAWAVKEGVTTGTSETTFDPETVCNRGHIVTFLYRAFAK